MSAVLIHQAIVYTLVCGIIITLALTIPPLITTRDVNAINIGAEVRKIRKEIDSLHEHVHYNPQPTNDSALIPHRTSGAIIKLRGDIKLLQNVTEKNIQTIHTIHNLFSDQMNVIGDLLDTNRHQSATESVTLFNGLVSTVGDISTEGGINAAKGLRIGDRIFNNEYTLPVGRGCDGQVLAASDGGATVSWQSIAGITDIGFLQTSVTQHDTDIGAIQTSVTQHDTDISVLQTSVTQQDTDIGVLQSKTQYQVTIEGTTTFNRNVNLGGYDIISIGTKRNENGIISDLIKRSGEVEYAQSCAYLTRQMRTSAGTCDRGGWVVFPSQTNPVAMFDTSFVVRTNNRLLQCTPASGARILVTSPSESTGVFRLGAVGKISITRPVGIPTSTTWDINIAIRLVPFSGVNTKFVATQPLVNCAMDVDYSFSVNTTILSEAKNGDEYQLIWQYARCSLAENQNPAVLSTAMVSDIHFESYSVMYVP